MKEDWDWRKANDSVATGECVEVCNVPIEELEALGGIAVRDSKRPEGDMLKFAIPEWRVFVAAAKAGDFDPGAM